MGRKIRKKKKRKYTAEELKQEKIERGELEEESSENEELSAAEENTQPDTDILIQKGNFSIVPSIKSRKTETVKRTLPNWLRSPSFIPVNLSTNKLPIEKFKHLFDDSIIKALGENNYKEFFPVQSTVISELLNFSCGLYTMPGCNRASDICCSAPTGSGKTLAFVLPVVQTLINCCNTKIRCLVVVPVVDLATQVFKVFQSFCKYTKLKVGLANGLRQFSVEQRKLVTKNSEGRYVSRVDIVVCTPGRLVDHLNSTPVFDLCDLRFIVIDEADRMIEEVKHDWLDLVEKSTNQNKEYPFKYDHLKEDRENDSLKPEEEDKTTKRKLYDVVASSKALSKTLIYDHFRVLHPAPKLPPQKLLFSATLSHNPEKLHVLHLHQPKLLTSAVGGGDGDEEGGGDGDKKGGGDEGVDVGEKKGDVRVNGKVRGDGGSDDEINNNSDDDDSDNDGDNINDGDDDDVSEDGDEKKGVKCKREEEEEEDVNVAKKKKEINDKTAKNEFLGKYVTPSCLNEYFIQSDAFKKPLLLLHLLEQYSSVLCFTNSVDSARRLNALMTLLGVESREFSSSLHVGRRARTVQAFNNHKIKLIVASDVMSRGLDLDDVDCVVSYNAPPSFKTYIHRVGRTARAGSSGTSVALLEKKEIFHFKKIIKESGKKAVKEKKVQGCLVEKHKGGLEEALKKLPEVLDKKKKKKDGEENKKYMKKSGKGVKENIDKKRKIEK